MVSIHKVPVIVHLIIRVISSTFRFKRGAVAHYPTPGIAKRPLCRYMKQQPTLYTDIIPAHDKEVYSRT